MKQIFSVSTNHFPGLHYCYRLLLALVLPPLLIGCGAEDSYPGRPITLVCPRAAGGGTDRVSRQIAVHLENDLGVPVNVINATGGRGVTGYSRGLHARPNGYTMILSTVELNMMHWIGLTGLTYRDGIPLMSLNEDSAAIVVRTDAPWQTLEELEVRALGVMSPQRVVDDPDVETFAAQGRDDSLGVWRSLMLPKAAPKYVSDVLVSSLQRIEKGQTNVGGKTFAESMKIEGFNSSWRSPEKFQAFLASPPSVALGLVSLLLWLGPAIHSFWHRSASA